MDPDRLPLRRYYQLVRISSERRFAEDRERRTEMLWLARMVANASWNPDGLIAEAKRLEDIYGDSSKKTPSNQHAGTLDVASRIIARREAAKGRVASN